MKYKLNFPKRIICLTEESVETLAHLERLDRVVGVSHYAKRPKEVQKLAKVSMFTSSDYKKILALHPDLIIGFSDIQQNIAKDLIGLGLTTYISNQRSLEEILDYIMMLSRLVDAPVEGQRLYEKLVRKLEEGKKFAKSLEKRPKVYFEEWDDPMITGIRWVSELIELCGGIDINREKAAGTLAKERFVNSEEIIQKNPDIIFACWCGKKVKLKSIGARKNYDKINAVKNGQVFELLPEIFLQPGPAPILDGIDILIDYFRSWSLEV